MLLEFLAEPVIWSGFGGFCIEEDEHGYSKTSTITRLCIFPPAAFMTVRIAPTGRPDRFLAFHFHDILLTNVVDVMPHPGTSAESVELVRAFAERLHQTVIVLERENFGYVFNAMLSDLFKSALTLASNGVAGVEDIDRAWMGVLRSPVGPFGMMDKVGLDTVWKINDYWAKATSDTQLAANTAFLKTRIDDGRLGMKSGAGFYTYPAPLFQEPDFLTGEA